MPQKKYWNTCLEVERGVSFYVENEVFDSLARQSVERPDIGICGVDCLFIYFVFWKNAGANGSTSFCCNIITELYSDERFVARHRYVFIKEAFLLSPPPPVKIWRKGRHSPKIPRSTPGGLTIGCNWENSLPDMASTFAPLATSNLPISCFPQRAVWWRGVYPLSDSASTLAPYFNSNSTPLSWPNRAARCRGVKNRGPAWISVSAPLLRRVLRTLSCPASAA